MIIKTLPKNVSDWLRQEAHVVAGPAFELDNCSCLPVSPQPGAVPADDSTPLGFLITRGKDLRYLDVYSPEGKQMLNAWKKNHLIPIPQEATVIPTEYWYG